MSPVPLLTSLAHQTRIDIIKLLDAEGELNVNEVSEKLGQPQAGISRHLIILRDSGAVEVEPRQASRFYSVSKGIVGLVRIAEELV